MDRWYGRTAVVTGASVGIGAAICIKLANSGLRVVGLARRAHLVDELKSQVVGCGSIESLSCDIGRPEEVITAFRVIEENYGGVHVLVNNAGVLYTGHITDVGDSPINDDNILSTIDTNVKGLVLCTRHAVAFMKKHNINGHIININSIAGHYVPHMTDFNVYPATKWAVTAFTKSLHNELARYNSKIKVTSISPGFVNTAMVEREDRHFNVPMLNGSDIADCVYYVLSTPPYVNINELGITHVSENKV